MTNKKFFSPDEAMLFCKNNLELYLETGKLLLNSISNSKFTFYCSICNRMSKALPTNDWNLRNSIICEGCLNGGRTRHVFSVLKELMQDRIYSNRLIFEDITIFKKTIDNFFGEFTGCEYLGHEKVSGQHYKLGDKLVMHQDMCAMSYSDSSLDLICSLDVLEHVYDMSGAIKELHRVLTDDGVLVLTVPFYDNRVKSTIRAIKTDVGILNLEPPEYHGNPLSKEGSLVFTEPGLDLLNLFKISGFDTLISLGANLQDGLFPDANPNYSFHCWNIVFILKKLQSKGFQNA